MKILALEPYYGGSHRAFLDGWSARSRHNWEILGLPAHKWKWRMRHAAVTLADQVCGLPIDSNRFDLLICSDMLNLAEFKGLVPAGVNRIPSVAYFHENQFTYPVPAADERDLHLGMINFTTSLAADQVWFNSAFHRDSFFDALRSFLSRMPDYNELDVVDKIRAKTHVVPQGITPVPAGPSRLPGPPHILWAARWEYDKNPDMFFKVLFRLAEEGLSFRLSVVGERFRQQPPIFAQARQRLADHIGHWGYQVSRVGYERVLSEADLVVSTADHEFFGVSIVEAVAAGAFPILPRRLSYPEIFGACEEFFYDGSEAGLEGSLRRSISACLEGSLWGKNAARGQRLVEPYLWDNLAPRLDGALDEIISG